MPYFLAVAYAFQLNVQGVALELGGLPLFALHQVLGIGVLAPGMMAEFLRIRLVDGQPVPMGCRMAKLSGWC
jgi:hypothetical protein